MSIYERLPGIFHYLNHPASSTTMLAIGLLLLWRITKDVPKSVTLYGSDYHKPLAAPKHPIIHIGLVSVACAAVAAVLYAGYHYRTTRVSTTTSETVPSLAEPMLAKSETPPATAKGKRILSPDGLDHVLKFSQVIIYPHKPNEYPFELSVSVPTIDTAGLGYLSYQFSEGVGEIEALNTEPALNMRVTMNPDKKTVFLNFDFPRLLEGRPILILVRSKVPNYVQKVVQLGPA